MIDDSWVLEVALEEPFEHPGVQPYADAFKEALGKHFEHVEDPEERRLLYFGALTALRCWAASVAISANRYLERHPEVDYQIALKRCTRILGSWVPSVEIALARQYVEERVP